MDQLLGYTNFFISVLLIGGIYAIAALGLNVNWGFTGLLNVGVLGFFGVGAYTSGMLTKPPAELHLGGFDLVGFFGQFGFTIGGFELTLSFIGYLIGFLASLVTAGIIAYFVGRICLRLRSDYLAIATIGIAEIIRLFLKNEQDITGGSVGMSDIPKPFEGLGEPFTSIGFLVMVAACVGIVYLLLQRAIAAPWGRTLRAIRDNEDAAAAAGKNVEGWRLEGFVLGAAIMGLAGALTAHSSGFFSPQNLRPENTTFLIWVMLIIGGSGNNRGAIVGALVIWAIWSGVDLLVGIFDTPPEIATQVAYIKVFLIGLFLQIVLQFFPKGLLSEKPPPDILRDQRRARAGTAAAE